VRLAAPAARHPARTRSLLLALAALCAGGCCLDATATDACIVDDGAGGYCYELFRERVCLNALDATDPPPPLQQDSRSCLDVLHEDAECADYGFTQACPGGYRVRPGWPC
jgi:hypothetical protein